MSFFERRCAWLALVAASSIGCGPKEPVPAAPSAPVTADSIAAVAATPEPPLDVHPRASRNAIVARARVSALDKARLIGVALAAGRDLDELGLELGLGPGELTGPAAMEKLGIDPSGTVTFESFELDERANAGVARLKKPDCCRSDEQTASSVFAMKREAGWFLSRVEISTKGDALDDLVERNLMRNDAVRTSSGPLETTFTLGQTVWLVKKQPTSLRIELAVSMADARSRDVRSARNALASWQPTTAPALEPGQDFVLSSQPEAAADAGFFIALQDAVRATGRDMDPAAAQSMVVERFRDAQTLYGIDAPTRAQRYGSVVFETRGNAATFTSTLASTTEPFRPEAWTKTGADLAIDGAAMLLSINGPLAYGWKMIPDSPGKNAYYLGHIGRAAKKAGFPALVLLAGEAPFAVARAILEDAEGIGQATLPFMARFERLGFAILPAQAASRPEVYFGLMASGATEENAACVLAKKDKGCTPAERLKANAIVTRDGFTVTRRSIDKRWVVLAAKNEAALKAIKPRLVSGARAPYSLHLDLVAASNAEGKHLGKGFDVYDIAGDLAPDAKSFRFTAKPAPVAAHP